MLDVMWFLIGIVFFVAMKAINKLIEKKYPKRTWVGLTDKERETATGWSVEHIEDFLKQKNGYAEEKNT